MLEYIPQSNNLVNNFTIDSSGIGSFTSNLTGITYGKLIMLEPMQRIVLEQPMEMK